MISRMQIIDAARECVETPYHHQGRVIGVGLDCVGLLVHVAKRCGIQHVDRFDYTQFSTNADPIETELHRIGCQQVEEMKLGDVIVFHTPRRFVHSGILVGPYRMVDVWNHAGKKGKTVEREITATWKAKIWSIWRFPGVEDDD